MTVETEVACVHVYLLGRFWLAPLLDARGLYRQYRESLPDVPRAFEAAEARGRDAYRCALDAARDRASG